MAPISLMLDSEALTKVLKLMFYTCETKREALRNWEYEKSAGVTRAEEWTKLDVSCCVTGEVSRRIVVAYFGSRFFFALDSVEA